MIANLFLWVCLSSFQGFKRIESIHWHASSRSLRVTDYCQRRFWFWEALHVLPRARDVNRVWTWCKPKCMVYIEMGSMWTYHYICKLRRAKRVWNRLCQIWLHHMYTSPLGGLGHLSGLNRLFLGYSILSKSVFWPVLPQPYNRPEASGQAHTWPNCPLTHVVHGTPSYAEIRQFFWMSCAPKMIPFAFF